MTDAERGVEVAIDLHGANVIEMLNVSEEDVMKVGNAVMKMMVEVGRSVETRIIVEGVQAAATKSVGAAVEKMMEHLQAIVVVVETVQGGRATNDVEMIIVTQ